MFLDFARDVHDVFEMKFVEKNVLCECAIHLLHVMHSQVNLCWFWNNPVFFFPGCACSLSTTNKSNLFFLPNCVLHFRELDVVLQHVCGQVERFGS